MTLRWCINAVTHFCVFVDQHFLFSCPSVLPLGFAPIVPHGTIVLRVLPLGRQCANAPKLPLHCFHNHRAAAWLPSCTFLMSGQLHDGRPFPGCSWLQLLNVIASFEKQWWIWEYRRSYDWRCWWIWRKKNILLRPSFDLSMCCAHHSSLFRTINTRELANGVFWHHFKQEEVRQLPF